MNQFVGFLIFLLDILLAIVIVPVLAIFHLLFGTYRNAVNLIALICRPDFEGIVSNRDSIFANDNFLRNPKSTIMVISKLKSNPTIHELREYGVKTLSDQKYKPLQQYFVKWGGFVFRKNEENFDYANHIKYWTTGNEYTSSAPVITPNNLTDIRRKLLLAPYKPASSPWEMLIVENYREHETSPNETVILTKFHHAIADGFSLIKVLLEDLGNVNILESIPQARYGRNSLTVVDRIKLFTWTALRMPSTMWMQQSTVDPSNIFHPLRRKLKGRRHPVTSVVSVSRIKAIAKCSDTSFTAVLMGGLTGGIRNFMISQGLPVPETIDATIPLPWPAHGQVLRNKFTFGLVNIPTGITDGRERLRCIHKCFLRLKNSTAPSLNYALGHFVGGLPTPLMSAVLKSVPSSILFSSIPGPMHECDFCGHPVDYGIFEGGYGQGDLGMGVSMGSYNGLIQVSINPDEAIVGNMGNAQKLLNDIINEFQLLFDIFHL